MASEPLPDHPTIDLREQLVRIDQMHAMIQQALANAAKTQLDTRLAPWQVFATVLGGAAAFFAGGIAFAKLFIG